MLIGHPTPTTINVCIYIMSAKRELGKKLQITFRKLNVVLRTTY